MTAALMAPADALGATGWQELLSELVASGAWPMVALILGFALRGSIARVLESGRLKRVSAGLGGVEVELFEAKLDEAAAHLVAEPATSHTSTAGMTAATEDEMTTLALISPRAAVLEGFSRLQAALDDGLNAGREDESRVVHGRAISPRSLAARAEKVGLLTPDETLAFEDLIPLRNAVAHARSDTLSTETALKFVHVADRLEQAVVSRRRGGEGGEP